MKKNKTLYNYFLNGITLFLIITGLCCSTVTAQKPEKRGSSMHLYYYKKSDLSRTAVVELNGKNTQGKFYPVRRAEINFYILDKGEKKFLNSAFTDVSGDATVALPKEMPLDENLSFTIISKFENDSVYENAEEEVHYKDATFSLKSDASDTNHLAIATLMEVDKDGKEIPVKGAEIKFYVQRLFGVMPAAEDYSVTTDENGKAEFSYPRDLKGDTTGALVLVAKIEDNEQYGNIESKASAGWGIPVIVDKHPFPRALWEPTAPYPLIITIVFLFGGVWSIYSVIFFTLYKIKKESKVKSS
jgi:hypothetical protein